TDHHVRVDEGAPEIGLVELEEDDVALPLLGLDDIEGALDRVLAPSPADLVEPESLGLRARRRVRDHDVLPAHAAGQDRTMRHLLADARAGGPIAETAQHRVDPALER